MRVMSWTRPCHSLFYLTLLLWTRRMDALADFSSKTTMKWLEEERVKSGFELKYEYILYHNHHLNVGFIGN